jgi:alpha-D-xyloside xylohydrolase
MMTGSGRPVWKVAVAGLLFCLGASSLAAAALERQADGILLPVGGGLLRVAVCAENVVRVAYARDRAFFSRTSLATAPRRCDTVAWNLATGATEATLTTARLKVRVDLASGALRFLDAAGRPVLAEEQDGRTMTSGEVQGEQTSHVRQQWVPAADEALYGLGQHQLGLLDIKGYDLDLWQHNGTVIVPFLVSSRGYGILWDNTSFTRFGDLRPFEPVPAAQLLDATGTPGGLTGSYYAGSSFERLLATRVDPRVDVLTMPGPPLPSSRIHPALPEGNFSVRWEGAVQPESTGDYLFRTYSNNGVKLWIDDRLVADHWRQGWLPWYDVARVRLTAGRRYRLKLEWTREQGMETMQLLWKTPAASAATSLWSEAGEGIDYQVVAGYRRIAGEAPLMPLWAYGMWQCRERYRTAQESLDVLEGFRSRGIPIDNIVQDWFYWKEDQWGSQAFDRERFPDPEGWIRAIHDKYHARLMISVWPKFYPETENGQAMRARGFLYEPNLREGLRDWVGQGYVSTFYDAFNPEARQLFWSLIERELFRKKVDAWWLDATEPDLTPTPTLEGQRTHMHPTFLGSGARMLNAYSLMNSEAIYTGQRAAAPNQRVFILTRSGFAGQQRYAAATWSGDITSTWTALKAQIPAGLSFSLSGLPYWTTDSGGFAVPWRFEWSQRAEDIEEWRELNARWFQFATFCPLLQVHGQSPKREMWEFGGESHPTYETQLKFDRLRYRLLPYVYSLADRVTHAGGTIMRALVMDFREDAEARAIGDQFLFGPALLVSPVTTYQARSRSVYLPRGAVWYDFWTGAQLDGGRAIDAPAPFDSLPLHVRAGSILPLGPEIQYTAEKPADPMTLYVFAGANGELTLYEDEGLSYDYERGACARIPLKWTDATRTLTLGARRGSFPGMLAARTFEIVLVSKDRPVGFSFTPRPDRSVRYEGRAVEVRLD